MSETKVKIDVNDLAVGMYVIELDIPWLDSPFLFQGFPIKCDEEIEEIKGVCQFVYIDPSQSTESVRADITEYGKRYALRMGQAQQSEQAQNKISYNFHEHLHLARKIYDTTRDYVTGTYNKVRNKQLVDVQAAKNLVSDIIENIIINPNSMMWLTQLKARHEYTLTHSINVCILALTLGRHMKIHATELQLLGLGALLHDIGKLRIPPQILDKPGKLTEQEFKIMQQHPVEGYKILKQDVNMPQESLEIVAFHHERINGKGYPKQLGKDQIKKLVKLTSIVDVYDAITSDRCYHDGISPYKALQNIYSWTSGHFEKEYVEAFMECMGIYPVGTIVKLNDGKLAVVISSTTKTRLRPIILLIKDANGEFYKQRKIYNLSTQEWDRKDKRLEISSAIEPKETDINVQAILEQESLSPQHNQARFHKEMGSLLS